jgi:hypothetical protein
MAKKNYCKLQMQYLCNLSGAWTKCKFYQPRNIHINIIDCKFLYCNNNGDDLCECEEAKQTLKI